MRNHAHLLLAESGFFYRKAEMLNRMVESVHKQNARINLQAAIQRAQSVLELDSAGGSGMKEITQAKNLLQAMKTAPQHVRSVIKVDWDIQRLKHDSATSSDMTQSSSSDMEVRSTTMHEELVRSRHKQALIQLQVQIEQEKANRDIDSDSDI